MEHKKSWHKPLIIIVLLLTIYNILPTIFYYSKPLKSPVDRPLAENIAKETVQRVNGMQEDAVQWLTSFSSLLKLRMTSVETHTENAKFLDVTFQTAEEAHIFARFLERAGNLIFFTPAKLAVSSTHGNKVTVERELGFIFPEENLSFFQYSLRLDKKGVPTPLYQEIVKERLQGIVSALNAPLSEASWIPFIEKKGMKNQNYSEEGLLEIGRILSELHLLPKDTSSFKSRFVKALVENDKNKSLLIDSFQKEISLLENEIAVVSVSTNASFEQRDLKNNLLTFQNALLELQSVPLPSSVSFSEESFSSSFAKGVETLNGTSFQTFSLDGNNPFVESLSLNWAQDKVIFNLYPEVQKLLSNENTEYSTYVKNIVEKWLLDNLGMVSRLSNEKILPSNSTFSVAFSEITQAKSFLALDLKKVAVVYENQLEEELNNSFERTSRDLQNDVFPVSSMDQFVKADKKEQSFGLVVFAPITLEKTSPSYLKKGFHKGSLYVIARGVKTLNDKTQNKASFEKDLNALNQMLQPQGFIAFSGDSFGLDPFFKDDIIFEKADAYSTLLAATREKFYPIGSYQYAMLDFTDIEERILTQNKIEDAEQEDLLRWYEEYNSAQADSNLASKYEIPKPTKNPYLQNFKTSFLKYFRGDDRKILKWGLDLSGGKTVRVGLVDQNGKKVTHKEDLEQAVNELYRRINRLGVSEQTIRIENDTIAIDFPGSQKLSASELIKASSMSFHLVNETYTPSNKALRQPVSDFLQNVWNEAVVTNKKDIHSLQTIAYRHLGGNIVEGKPEFPQSEAAKILVENGLTLADPEDSQASNAFNETFSKVAKLRGNDFSDWHGQSHPLLIVFNNYALQGANLDNVRIGFDPKEGNNLSFTVKNSYEGERKGNPRDDFYAWTSAFSEEKIAGTPSEKVTSGRGYRMAAILNDEIINTPVLKASLRDGATISGRFSQREVNSLAADLKAGSLSFTPKILAEQNISAELGMEERSKGIAASLFALFLVVVAMTGYYRFAGVVASVAVLLNILILWGVLQNLGAALTLPGIAGIVLTIGMAVDANVLVFERVREELKAGARLSAALHLGYKKAFSAIVDSNITTIIAALILIQFDSGPIKGFAVTLIIGIISSMFTALFVTRVFFAEWVKNTKHKTLNMSQFFGETHFDFLKKAPFILGISLVFIVASGALFISQKNTIFGMDFVGGYSLNVKLEEKEGVTSYRTLAKDALHASGIPYSEFEIRELGHPNDLRIQFSIGMEEKGHAFNGLPERASSDNALYAYQNNPRITFIVNALESQGLQVEATSLPHLEENWTIMSGQFSDAMRFSALSGLGLALLAILVYITFRFEFKFAISSVVGLAYDILITLGVLAIFHALGFPVDIDLQVIGAIMTIIGYSLNDTIIVFDRIREDMHVLKRLSFYEIINHAANVTLSRTIMTSGTTLLVLLSLVFLGGESIFNFAFVMSVGVIVGTFSSLFVAGPCLLFFHEKEIKEKKIHLKKA